MGGYGNPGLQSFMQSFKNVGVGADYITNADTSANAELSARMRNAACKECREEICGKLGQELARNKDEQEKAMLASASYGDPNAPLPPGYRRATDQDLRDLGLLDADGNSLLELEGHPDFNAEVFAKNDGSYVIGFQGTNATSWDDWKSNFGQGAGKDTAYYETAAAIGKRVREMQIENVSFVGHSLGGGLASTASGASGLLAQTFNAAGLHENTLSGLDYADPSLVSATYVIGDILNGLQDHSPMRSAYGIRRGIEPADSWKMSDLYGLGGAAVGLFTGPGGAVVGGTAGVAGTRGVRLHLMDAVKSALEKEHQEIVKKMRENGCA